MFVGFNVVFIEGYGVSFWVNIGWIDVELEDGFELFFFIKVLFGEIGFKMVKVEFEFMKVIYFVIFDFVLKLIVYGLYDLFLDIYFFLCEFWEMVDD